MPPAGRHNFAFVLNQLPECNSVFTIRPLQ